MRSIGIAFVAAAVVFGSLSARAQEQEQEGAQPVTVTPPSDQPVAETPPGAAQPNPSEAAERAWGVEPRLFGYVKAGYFLVTPLSEDVLVGSNSGFRLINARLGVSLRVSPTVEAVLSIDGAVSQRDELDPLEGSRIVAVKDAYVEWEASRFGHLRAGQFKAPFNAESLLPDDSLPFITRSIVSEGLQPPEGFRVHGLALSRQIGVQLASDVLGEDVRFQYAVALVNGNGENVLNNDNNNVAPAARVQVGYRDLVTVGANAFQNRALIGERPARISQSQLAYGGDVTVNVAGVNLFGMYLQRRVTHEADTGLPSEDARGVVASARYLYEPLGVEAGARFAYYEPSTATEADIQTEISAMVGYRPEAIPARIVLQYTLRGEESGAEVGNNSVDLLAQVTF